jgi:hypothetical protein
MRSFSFDSRQKAALLVGNKSEKRTFPSFRWTECHKFISLLPLLLSFQDEPPQQAKIVKFINIGHILFLVIFTLFFVSRITEGNVFSAHVQNKLTQIFVEVILYIVECLVLSQQRLFPQHTCHSLLFCFHLFRIIVSEYNVA